MKRLISIVLIVVMVVCLLSGCDSGNNTEKQSETVDYGKVFYVSLRGDDANDGTKDAPLASFNGAVAKVREYKQTNGLPEGGIKVEFAEGIYSLTSTVVLSSEDSGEEGKTIVYAAADGVKVVFDGGITLEPSDFKPANDDFKVLLQTEDAKNNVLEIDLAAAGAYNLEDPDVYSSGNYPNDYGYRQTLYVNDVIQTVAKWPNEGKYAKAELVTAWDGNQSVIKVPEDKLAVWSACENLRVYGMGRRDWDPHFSWHNSIDVQSGTMSVLDEYNDKMPYFVFNVPQELDEPGEYYWDVSAKKLYYWPSDNFESAKVRFSQLSEYAVYMQNVSYITLDGLGIENVCNRGFVGEDVSYLTLRNCSLNCCGGTGMRMNGTNLVFDHNIFSMLSAEGISISGGTFEEPAHNEFTNNLLSDFGQLYTISKGIQSSGYGLCIAHNEVCHAPHAAMMLYSGHTFVEYNYVHDVCEEPEILDCGAIYTCRYWTWSGGYFRYNIVENCIRNAFYMDDTMPFTELYGNILVNIGGNAFALGGGRNIKVYNNVLVKTGGISFDCRGADWYPTVTSYPEGSSWDFNIKWSESNESSPEIITAKKFWRYAFPQSMTVLEMRTTEELKSLKGVVFEILDSPGPAAYADIYGNIGYGNESTNVPERTSYIFNRNRYIALNNNEDGSSPVSAKITDPVYWFGSIHDNIEYTDYLNDIFVDPVNGNFFLKDDSRVYRDIVGFEKWDYSLIGIQK